MKNVKNKNKQGKAGISKRVRGLKGEGRLDQMGEARTRGMRQRNWGSK